MTGLPVSHAHPYYGCLSPRAAYDPVRTIFLFPPDADARTEAEAARFAEAAGWKALAEENGIPWQTKTRIAGGTDASVIQRSGTGVRVAALSVAVRNIHSPASVAKISECEDQCRLARLFLEEKAK